jgi:radical SAM protein with 4Fe4S-binding SPASM domain
LTTEQSLRLIDQLAEFPSPPMLVLTGGDPLKRADICDLIRRAVRHAIDVSITPSATPLVTQDAMKRLHDAGISRLAVSVDGADASMHDAIRGVAGSFDKSLQILADARTLGIPTQVNTTITPRNVAQIDRMAELVADYAIAMWSVFFLVPTGRAQFEPRLSAEECEAAFERLWRQSQRQPYAIKTTEAPHYRRYVIQRRRAKDSNNQVASWPRRAPLGVNDGKGVMFINHAGEVYPSGFLPIVCGLFPADNVVNVYQKSLVFRALRDANQLEGKCKVCNFRQICGGSRARAYALTGNPFAEELDCAYVPEAFSATS